MNCGVHTLQMKSKDSKKRRGEKNGSKNQIEKNGTEESSFL